MINTNKCQIDPQIRRRFKTRAEMPEFDIKPIFFLSLHIKLRQSICQDNGQQKQP